jgi:uncharacterized protein (TIGR04255 family)
MSLPKRITPDSIIDAAVETRYASKYPFEILNGIIFSYLQESYRYTTRPLKPNIPLPTSNPITAITMNIGSQSLFYNDAISIRLLPNALIFGCVENYIGWGQYSAEIARVLMAVGQIEQIDRWVRVGIRYTTEYVNTDLKDCTKFNFTFGMPEVQSTSTFFRTELRYRDANVILSLNNKVPAIRQIPGENTAQVVATSTIDIDTIREPLAIDNIPELMAVLHSTHDTEKEIFFRLLKEEFLQTLKPEY